jgi:serine/threonine-protein kinase
VTHKRGEIVNQYFISRRFQKSKPVYLAHHIETGQAVALKQAEPYDREDGTDPKTIGELCLRHEADVQRRCAHPNIAPVERVFTFRNETYMAMPYLGRNLERFSRKKEEEKLSILEQIATALSYCHEKGIVHMDVKPKNIFVRKGKAALGDFGAAKTIGIAHPHLPFNTCIATPNAVAPEYLFNNTYDERSDTFSYSIMAYELLTGRLPYKLDGDGFILYDYPLFSEGKLIRFGELGELIFRGMQVMRKERPYMPGFVNAFKQSARSGHQPNEYSSTLFPVSYLASQDQKTTLVTRKEASYETGPQPQPAHLS